MVTSMGTFTPVEVLRNTQHGLTSRTYEFITGNPDHRGRCTTCSNDRKENHELIRKEVRT